MWGRLFRDITAFVISIIAVCPIVTFIAMSLIVVAVSLIVVAIVAVSLAAVAVSLAVVAIVAVSLIVVATVTVSLSKVEGGVGVGGEGGVDGAKVGLEGGHTVARRAGAGIIRRCSGVVESNAGRGVVGPPAGTQSCDFEMGVVGEDEFNVAAVAG